MKNQIQTASEVKNSSLTRTLAHETRKIRMRTICMLSQMKNAIIFFILFGCLAIPYVQSQDFDHIDGGQYSKRIEYNIRHRGEYTNVYNLRSKDDREKLFFGEINSPVEFFCSPSNEGASGFRILMDSLNNSYMLEIKYISNYEWVIRFNRSEWLKQYKVETKSFSISKQLADEIYQNMVFLISNFKGKGVGPRFYGGLSVTFRTVVEDEVWSLWIHNPQENANKIAMLCRKIITDAIANELDESEYINILKSL